VSEVTYAILDPRTELARLIQAADQRIDGAVTHRDHNRAVSYREGLAIALQTVDASERYRAEGEPVKLRNAEVIIGEVAR